MTNKLKSVLLAALLAGCGGSKPTAALESSNPGQGKSQPVDSNPTDIQSPSSNEHICPTFNYPVTLYGVVQATDSDPAKSEYFVKNGTLLVYLKTTAATDPDLINHLKMLNGIAIYGGADGCVSGRNLPAMINGRLVFEVEKGAVAIESGGFSVSN